MSLLKETVKVNSNSVTYACSYYAEGPVGTLPNGYEYLVKNQIGAATGAFNDCVAVQKAFSDLERYLRKVVIGEDGKTEVEKIKEINSSISNLYDDKKSTKDEKRKKEIQDEIEKLKRGRRSLDTALGKMFEDKINKYNKGMSVENKTEIEQIAYRILADKKALLHFFEDLFYAMIYKNSVYLYTDNDIPFLHLISLLPEEVIYRFSRILYGVPDTGIEASLPQMLNLLFWVEKFPEYKQLVDSMSCLPEITAYKTKKQLIPKKDLCNILITYGDKYKDILQTLSLLPDYRCIMENKKGLYKLSLGKDSPFSAKYSNKSLYWGTKGFYLGPNGRFGRAKKDLYQGKTKTHKLNFIKFREEWEKGASLCVQVQKQSGCPVPTVKDLFLPENERASSVRHVWFTTLEGQCPSQWLQNYTERKNNYLLLHFATGYAQGSKDIIFTQFKVNMHRLPEMEDELKQVVLHKTGKNKWDVSIVLKRKVYQKSLGQKETIRIAAIDMSWRTKNKEELDCITMVDNSGKVFNFTIDSKLLLSHDDLQGSIATMYNDIAKSFVEWHKENKVDLSDYILSKVTEEFGYQKLTTAKLLSLISSNKWTPAKFDLLVGIFKDIYLGEVSNWFNSYTINMTLSPLDVNLPDYGKSHESWKRFVTYIKKTLKHNKQKEINSINLYNTDEGYLFLLSLFWWQYRYRHLNTWYKHHSSKRKRQRTECTRVLAAHIKKLGYDLVIIEDLTSIGQKKKKRKGTRIQEKKINRNQRRVSPYKQRKALDNTYKFSPTYVPGVEGTTKESKTLQQKLLKMYNIKKTKDTHTYKFSLNNSILKVPPAYTSRICFNCGHLNKANSDKYLICEQCGTEYDRDVNAAINIFRRGINYLIEETSDGKLKQKLETILYAFNDKTSASMVAESWQVLEMLLNPPLTEDASPKRNKVVWF